MSIKSELTKTASYLRKTRKAILGRGGEISPDAGMKDLPEAIFNIPADTSLSFYEDAEISYKKTVPSGAEEYALLKSVGGMTYKSNNLVNIPDIYAGSAEGTNSSGIAIDVHLANTIYVSAEIIAAVSSTIWRLRFIHKDGTSQYLTDVDFNYGGGKIVVSADNPIMSIVYRSTYITEGKYSGFMVSYGEKRVPYEPYFEGLRDTKVTEIVSYGANRFDISRAKIESLYEGLSTEVIENSLKVVCTVASRIGYINLGTYKAGTYTIRTLINGTQHTSSIWTGNDLNSLTRIGTFSDQSPYVTITLADEQTVWLGVTCNNTIGTYYLTEMMVASGVITEYMPYREPITYLIPEEVQVERGVNENYRDYIEFKGNRVLKHNNCGIATLNGSETWLQYPNVENTYYANIPNKAKGYQTSMCSDFNNLNMAWVNGKVGDYSDSPTTTYVYFKTVYSSVEDWKAHLAEKPIELAYAVAEPNTEDVTDLFTNFDNFLSVEGGGTLEFVNEHSNAVPSTVKYTVKVGN